MLLETAIACAVQKSDGSVWAWGHNDIGQLGNGTQLPSDEPIHVKGLTDVIAVAATSYSVALKKDGTVWTWGNNLGDGTDAYSLIPKQASGIGSVVAIAASSAVTVALKNDGTVWCWGKNGFGQLGVDSNINASNVPLQVKGLTDVTAIAVNEQHALALKKDGSVWTWGYNLPGMPAQTESAVPIKVPVLQDIVAILAHYYDAIALGRDGRAWVWGNNEPGENRDGKRFITPNRLTGVSNISTGAIGDGHIAIVTNTGDVWDWGDNRSGQLGNGGLAASKVPVRVLDAGGAGFLNISGR